MAKVQILDQILGVHNSEQYAIHLCGTLASEWQAVWRVLFPFCTQVFPRGGWTSCQTGVQVRADTYAVRMLSRAATQAEKADRKCGRTEASTEEFWSFLKNSHCLYAKSPRIWKLYQLRSNAIYALLTMTRSRYLKKRLRQGNACRETAQNILPASNTLQGRDHLDHTSCVCVHQPSTDFSGDSLNSQRPLSPSTSCVKQFHRACTRCLKSHLGFCPETSYPLVSFMCLHWKRWWKPFPVLPLPGTQGLPLSLLCHLFSS